jgi:hypothetical protein
VIFLDKLLDQYSACLQRGSSHGHVFSDAEDEEDSRRMQGVQLEVRGLLSLFRLCAFNIFCFAMLCGAVRTGDHVGSALHDSFSHGLRIVETVDPGESLSRLFVHIHMHAISIFPVMRASDLLRCC